MCSRAGASAVLADIVAGFLAGGTVGMEMPAYVLIFSGNCAVIVSEWERVSRHVVLPFLPQMLPEVLPGIVAGVRWGTRVSNFS